MVRQAEAPAAHQAAQIFEIGRVLAAAGGDAMVGEVKMRPLLFRFEAGGDEGA